MHDSTRPYRMRHHLRRTLEALRGAQRATEAERADAGAMDWSTGDRRRTKNQRTSKNASKNSTRAFKGWFMDTPNSPRFGAIKWAINRHPDRRGPGSVCPMMCNSQKKNLLREASTNHHHPLLNDSKHHPLMRGLNQIGALVVTGALLVVTRS